MHWGFGLPWCKNFLIKILTKVSNCSIVSQSERDCESFHQVEILKLIVKLPIRAKRDKLTFDCGGLRYIWHNLMISRTWV